MRLANCHKCGTQGKTIINRFTGDSYFAYCPKCLQFGEMAEAPTRNDAVREWNDLQDVGGAMKTAKMNK